MCVCVISDEPLVSQLRQQFTHKQALLIDIIQTHWYKLLVRVQNVSTLYTPSSIPPSELLDIRSVRCIGRHDQSILNALSFDSSSHLIIPWLHSTLLTDSLIAPIEGFSLSNGSAMLFPFTFGAIHSPHRVQRGHLTI